MKLNISQVLKDRPLQIYKSQPGFNYHMLVFKSDLKKQEESLVNCINAGGRYIRLESIELDGVSLPLTPWYTNEFDRITLERRYGFRQEEINELFKAVSKPMRSTFLTYLDLFGFNTPILLDALRTTIKDSIRMYGYRDIDLVYWTLILETKPEFKNKVHEFKKNNIDPGNGPDFNIEAMWLITTLFGVFHGPDADWHALAWFHLHEDLLRKNYWEFGHRTMGQFLHELYEGHLNAKKRIPS